MQVPRGKGVGRGEEVVRELGIDMHTPLLLKWTTNRDLLHSSGNPAHVEWQLG